MSPSPDLLLRALAETQQDAEIVTDALDAIALALADYATWRDPIYLDDARRALRSAGYDA